MKKRIKFADAAVKPNDTSQDIIANLTKEKLEQL